MSKRKKQRKSLFGKKRWWQRQPPVELEDTFNKVDSLILKGRAQEAVALLKPLLVSHPRIARLHYYLGYAYAKAGDIWLALSAYEQALKLKYGLDLWLPLASLYGQLGLNALALNAFRQVLKHQLDVPPETDVKAVVTSLESEVATIAHQLGIAPVKMEKGLRYMEEGQRALNSGDYRNCIAVNRKSIKLLGNWPPPHNNLSMALFFTGLPKEAIATARRVLSTEPDNLQALSNAIRYLAWTGKEVEAKELWTRLQKISPRGDNEHLKMAEAAAIVGEDKSVYQLLKPLNETEITPGEAPGSSHQVQLFLAIAEANTGQHRSARHRFKAMKQNNPRVANYLTALQTGQPGPGWAKRFPYFHSTEMMLAVNMETFMALVVRRDKISVKKFQREMTRFAERFPQITLVAEKLIIEENLPEPGMSILKTVGTPAAYAALRRFGLSQIGDDQMRLQALHMLMEADQITQQEKLRVWADGQWQEIQLRQYEILEEPEVSYELEIAELLNQGLKILKQNKLEEAEKLFKKALKLDPQAKEAYNNLGSIYSQRDEHARAKEMLQAAINIDPTYVFPRANLAIYLLNDNDIEGAEAMIAPLANVTQFQPLEMVFYTYVQARILVHKDESDKAQQMLEMALNIVPDYEPAQNLLERLDLSMTFQTNFNSFFEERQKRQQAARVRLQDKLPTATPSLSKALSIYTKDILTAMARVVILGAGWSGLRKAELLQRIIDSLNDHYSLEYVVTGLNDDEREVLRHVLAGDGHITWEDFDTRYGNDTEESPYWQYHEPKTVMGRLRLRGLLVEAKVNKTLLIVVPVELRQPLEKILV